MVRENLILPGVGASFLIPAKVAGPSPRFWDVLRKTRNVGILTSS